MEIFDPIIEFLGERRNVWSKHNWQYILVFGLSLSAYLGRREYAKRAQRRKEEQLDTLSNKTLTALIIASEEKGDVRYSATISPARTGFHVSITKGESPVIETVVDEQLPSLDDVEEFLRQNTKFLLSDFE